MRPRSTLRVLFAGEYPTYGSKGFPQRRNPPLRQYLVLPSRYGVRDVTSADRPLGDHLREIVSFRGRFAEQAKRGEWVQARGTLERVLWANGRTSIRLTVGGRPGDYLRSFPR